MLKQDNAPRLQLWADVLAKFRRFRVQSSIFRCRDRHTAERADDVCAHRC